ncbi:14-3-3 protein zeta-like [Halichondria panicea]|uniref:14-3-3 protein zeta-like n=1 Tax=Halichondria panicea TaxID=6063 RepID=UPI00312B41BE
MDSLDADGQVEFAQLAEQAERHEDMAKAMAFVAKERAVAKTPLTSNERNLLSIAFKHVVGARRTSWRAMASMETKYEEAKEYKDRIEKELNDICNQVIDLLTPIIENATENESKVFYNKMKGDYYRYRAEVASNDKNEIVGKAKEAYEAAVEAGNEMPSTHPIRLGLALNYSVFHYEIANEPEKACAFAKKAFDEAIAGLDDLKDGSSSYKDSTLIMQLLRDNLTLWTSADQEANEEGQN